MKPLVSESVLRDRIAEVAGESDRALTPGRPVPLIGILTGSVLFLGAL